MKSIHLGQKLKIHNTLSTEYLKQNHQTSTTKLKFIIQNFSVVLIINIQTQKINNQKKP